VQWKSTSQIYKLQDLGEKCFASSLISVLGKLKLAPLM